MYNPSLKPVLVGIAIGIVLFALPFFLLKAALFILFFGAMFRLIRRLYWSRQAQLGSYGPGRYPYRRYGPRGYGHRGYGHRGHGYEPELHPAFADTIRNMSDEQYDAFRQKLYGDRPDSSAAASKTTIEIQ